MQSSGTNDRVRSLIDSPLPDVTREILLRPQLFGAVIYAMGINLMGSFIHNDPISYAVLKDKAVPDAFLDTIAKDIAPSFDYLFAIPNALGAICLSASGLERVIAANPFPKFFDVFLSSDHMRALLDEDVSSALGTNFDELARHHPQLKPLILAALVDLLRKVVELGSTENDASVGVGVARNRAGYKLIVGTGDEGDVKFVTEEVINADEVSDSPIMNHVEVCARFMEGLF